MSEGGTKELFKDFVRRLPNRLLVAFHKWAAFVELDYHRGCPEMPGELYEFAEELDLEVVRRGCYEHVKRTGWAASWHAEQGKQPIDSIRAELVRRKEGYK